MLRDNEGYGLPDGRDGRYAAERGNVTRKDADVPPEDEGDGKKIK